MRSRLRSWLTERHVRVKFLKDDMTQSGDFSIIEIDGAKYGKIDFNKGLIRYASDRFLEIRACYQYRYRSEGTAYLPL